MNDQTDQTKEDLLLNLDEILHWELGEELRTALLALDGDVLEDLLNDVRNGICAVRQPLIKRIEQLKGEMTRRSKNEIALFKWRAKNPGKPTPGKDDLIAFLVGELQGAENGPAKDQ